MATDEMEQKVGLTIVNNEDGEPIVSGIYGKEVMFDMYKCDVTKFNRRELRKFFNRLVKLIDMEKGDLYFWDDVGVPVGEQRQRRQPKGRPPFNSYLRAISLSTVSIYWSGCISIFSRVRISTQRPLAVSAGNGSVLLLFGRTLRIGYKQLQKGKLMESQELKQKGQQRRQICRGCGCTNARACREPDGGPCYWVERDLCSVCAQKIREGAPC